VPAFNDCFRLSDQLRMCGELLVSQDDDLSHRDLPNFATALGLKMPLCLLDRPLSRQHPDRHAHVCEELGLSSDLLYALVSLDHWIAPVGRGQSLRGGGPLRQLALSYHDAGRSPNGYRCSPALSSAFCCCLLHLGALIAEGRVGQPHPQIRSAWIAQYPLANFVGIIAYVSIAKRWRCLSAV
jgi:hypothetical protein